MKKIRVLKEMPFAKVGEIIPETVMYSMYPENTKRLISEGWLEWVEEEKTLKEVLIDFKNKVKASSSDEIIGEIANTVKQHTLEVFDKAMKGINVIDGSLTQHIRKALEDM